MKKGLIGIMVLACVALISGTALAAQTFWSIDVSGSVEWIILNQTGLMPADTGGADEALVVPELKLTAGPWEAVAGKKLGDGYIKYTSDMGSITLDSAVKYDIFGLGGSIGNNKGVALATEMAPLSLSAVYQADQDYGLGLSYDAGVAVIGLAYNSVAWGAQMVATIAPMTITLKTALKDSLNAYGVGLAAGAISLGYDVTFDSVTTEAVDAVWEDVAGVWTKTTDYVAEELGGPVAKFNATLTGLSLTESTLLTIEVVNQDITDVNYAAGTTITATAVTALADAVKLTTKIASKPVTGVEYSAKIGVSF